MWGSNTTTHSFHAQKGLACHSGRMGRIPITGSVVAVVDHCGLNWEGFETHCLYRGIREIPFNPVVSIFPFPPLSPPPCSPLILPGRLFCLLLILLHASTFVIPHIAGGRRGDLAAKLLFSFLAFAHKFAPLYKALAVTLQNSFVLLLLPPFLSLLFPVYWFSCYS